MNKYELALVISAKIDDDARAEVLEKAKGFITRYDGVIAQVEVWGKKRLAYEIAHQREGYYYFIHFEAGPECPAQLESHVRIMDNVLRYLIVKSEFDDVIVQTPEEEPAPAAPAAEEAPAEEAPVEEAISEEAVAEEAPAEEAAAEAPAEEASAEE